MKKLVMSGIGPDKPGIVAAISELLYRCGGNIDDSTMTRLADEFAVILLVSVPDELDLAGFRDDMTALEASHGLTMLVKPAPDSLIQPTSLAINATPKPYMISVAGHDRTGITWRVSRVLAELDVNIRDLNARRIMGEDGPVYIMMVEVDVPPQTALPEVQAL